MLDDLEELKEMKDLDVDALLNDEPAPAPHSHGGKRKSLGRGLGALLGDDTDLNLDEELSNLPAAVASEANFVAIEALMPGRYQPRTEFDGEALQALADSIKEKGILQPLLVRKSGDKFEIIAGERRWRAAKMAGLDKLPVIEKDLSDREVLEVALVENLLRENLSAIEEAEGFQRLIDEFSHTQEALAQIVGKSRSHVANTLRLLSLPASVQELVKNGKLSAGHARCLVGLENAEKLAQTIISKDLNVRQVEDLVCKQKQPAKEKTAKAVRDADLEQIEKDLVKKLGLRIKISPSKAGGGKVVLAYASVAELDMILDLLEQNRKAETAPSAPVPSQPAAGEKFTIKMID